jgi:xylulokinase
VPSAGRFEHDADAAWRAGPLAALAEVTRSSDLDVKGVSVSAMVPSLTAVDREGRALLPGLLYGDERGRTGMAGDRDLAAVELEGFVRWATAGAPEAFGLWPAQAMANHALAGEAVLDTTTAATAHPLFDWVGWDAEIADRLGARVEQLPRLVPTGWEAGRVGRDGPALAAGCVDAFAEQLVAGADHEGDVLVLLGTTLVVWVVAPHDASVPGYLTVPHTAGGQWLVGGPSNAGGLFCDWVSQLFAPHSPTGHSPAGESPSDPHGIPVWAPYPRGERAPVHDPQRRAQLAGLDLTHDASAIRHAAYEASGFVVRRAIEAAREHAGAHAQRVVVSGGGTRVTQWVQAIADAVRLPVDCVAEPDGAALGSAWLARIGAGLEDRMHMTDSRRWARTARRIVPRPRWDEPVAERYERFLELTRLGEPRDEGAG